MKLTDLIYIILSTNVVFLNKYIFKKIKIKTVVTGHVRTSFSFYWTLINIK